jgi:hypothetical protein
VGEFDVGLDLFEDWEFWIRASRHYRFHHIRQVTAEYRFYGVDAAEKENREKHGYHKCLATIFNRSLPYLTGQGCARFLLTDFPSIAYGTKRSDDPISAIPSLFVDKNMQLNQLRKRLRNRGLQMRESEMRLEETELRLREACDTVIKLQEDNRATNHLLQEILSSKGWRWLSRYRSLKIRLGLSKAKR